MADYALAVDLGAEVTAAISDDEGPRVVPIGDADQRAMPAAVDAAGRLLVGDAAARWAGEPDLLWWKEQPAGSTVAPDDTAEHVVSEAERRVSQQIDGRLAALVVTTPTAFPADAAPLLVARLSQRYRGRRIDTHPAVCAAAAFAVQTGALTPDSRVLVVDWRSASLDLGHRGRGDDPVRRGAVGQVRRDPRAGSSAFPPGDPQAGLRNKIQVYPASTLGARPV